MSSELLNPNQDTELDPQKEYRALVRSIRWTKEFGLLFVQCSPAEGNRLIAKVRADLPKKKIEVLSLKESIDNLYDVVDALPNKAQIDVLFIQGLEHLLYEYEKTQLWDEPRDRYTYSEKGIPKVLGNLNLGRERFSKKFRFCFVFLVPLFAIKYLARRSPDFFDWRSGVFEIPTDPAILDRESSRLLKSHKDYDSWTQQDRDRRITEIQCWIEEPQQIPDLKAQLFLEQGDLLTASERYEAAIISYDNALKHKIDFYIAWYNRGVTFRRLERYGEAITSYAEALKYKPDFYTAWSSLGAALKRLECLEEAIASNNEAIKYKPDYSRAWYNNACYYALQDQAELAMTNLDKSINLNPKYREMAKTDSDFDSIRNHDRFQALINEA